ncbi:MAG: hypothetical protein V2A54_10335 [Bacteroidota bacterium]
MNVIFTNVRSRIRTVHPFVLIISLLAIALVVYNFFTFYNLYKVDLAWKNFFGDQLYLMQYSMLPGSEMSAYRIEHAPQFDIIAMITQGFSLSGVVFVLFHRWLAGFLIYTLSTIAMILVPIFFVRIDILIQWENAVLIAGIPFVISIIFAFSRKKIRKKLC